MMQGMAMTFQERAERENAADPDELARTIINEIRQLFAQQQNTQRLQLGEEFNETLAARVAEVVTPQVGEGVAARVVEAVRAGLEPVMNVRRATNRMAHELTQVVNPAHYVLT